MIMYVGCCRSSRILTPVSDTIPDMVTSIQSYVFTRTELGDNDNIIIDTDGCLPAGDVDVVDQGKVHHHSWGRVGSTRVILGYCKL